MSSTCNCKLNFSAYREKLNKIENSKRKKIKMKTPIKGHESGGERRGSKKKRSNSFSNIDLLNNPSQNQHLEQDKDSMLVFSGEENNVSLSHFNDRKRKQTLRYISESDYKISQPVKINKFLSNK